MNEKVYLIEDGTQHERTKRISGVFLMTEELKVGSQIMLEIEKAEVTEIGKFPSGKVWLAIKAIEEVKDTK